jgi:hypothetical protein
LWASWILIQRDSQDLVGLNHHKVLRISPKS